MVASMEKTTAIAYIFPGVSPTAIMKVEDRGSVNAGYSQQIGDFAAIEAQIKESHRNILQ